MKSSFFSSTKAVALVLCVAANAHTLHAAAPASATQRLMRLLYGSSSMFETYPLSDPRVLKIFKESCEKFGHTGIPLLEVHNQPFAAATNGSRIFVDTTSYNASTPLLHIYAHHENTHIKHKDCQKRRLLTYGEASSLFCYTTAQILSVTGVDPATIVPLTVYSAASYILFSLSKLGHHYYAEKRADTTACTMVNCPDCIRNFAYSRKAEDGTRGYLTAEQLHAIADTYEKQNNPLCQTHHQETLKIREMVRAFNSSKELIP